VSCPPENDETLIVTTTTRSTESSEAVPALFLVRISVPKTWTFPLGRTWISIARFGWLRQTLSRRSKSRTRDLKRSSHVDIGGWTSPSFVPHEDVPQPGHSLSAMTPPPRVQNNFRHGTLGMFHSQLANLNDHNFRIASQFSRWLAWRRYGNQLASQIRRERRRS